jgi:hypothetical protein
VGVSPDQFQLVLEVYRTVLSSRTAEDKWTRAKRVLHLPAGCSLRTGKGRRSRARGTSSYPQPEDPPGSEGFCFVTGCPRERESRNRPARIGIGRGWNARRHSGGMVEFVGASTHRVLLPRIATVGMGVVRGVSVGIGSRALMFLILWEEVRNGYVFAMQRRR